MKKKKAAFTLVEMIITLSLTVVILGLIYNIFTTGHKVFSDSDVKSTLQMEAKDIQEKVSNITMQASEVVPPLLSESLSIKSYIKEDDNLRYFKMQKNSKNLEIIQYADENYENIQSTQIISEHIESFNMNVIDNKSINFNIVLRKEKGFTDSELPLNFTVTLRNKI